MSLWFGLVASAPAKISKLFPLAKKNLPHENGSIWPAILLFSFRDPRATNLTFPDSYEKEEISLSASPQFFRERIIAFIVFVGTGYTTTDLISFAICVGVWFDFIKYFLMPKVSKKSLSYKRDVSP